MSEDSLYPINVNINTTQQDPNSKITLLTSPDTISYNLELPSNNTKGYLYNPGDGDLNWHEAISSVQQGTSTAPGIEFFNSFNSAGLYNKKILSKCQITKGPSFGYANTITYSPKLGIYMIAGCYTNASTSLGYSYDGVNWITTNVNPQVLFADVIWSAEFGYFVCLIAQDNTNNFISAITTDGITFETFALPSNTGCFFTSMVWSPAAKCFVAVSGERSPGIAYSNDGKIWIIIDPPNNMILKYVMYYPKRKILLAFGGGNGGENSNFCYSFDRTKWYAPGNTLLDINNVNVYGGCYSPSLDLVVLFSDTTPNTYTSTDGLSWSAHNVNINSFLYKITWIEDLQLFVAPAAESYQSNIWVSKDSIEWNILPIPKNDNYSGFITPFWDTVNKRLIVNDLNGYVYSFTGHDNIVVNTDFSVKGYANVQGTLNIDNVSFTNFNKTVSTNQELGAWKHTSLKLQNISNQEFQNVAYSPKYDYMIGVGGLSQTLGNCCATSTNGINWIKFNFVNSIAYWNDAIWIDALGLFIVVGGAHNDSHVIFTAYQRETYIWGDISPVQSLNSIAWSDSLNLAVIGSVQGFYYSYDASTWNYSTSQQTFNVAQVRWIKEKEMFIAVGTTILYSSDGINWTQATRVPSGEFSYISVAYSKKFDLFIATSGNGMVTSRNADTWIPYTFLYGINPYKVQWIDELEMFICTTGGSSYRINLIYGSTEEKKWVALDNDIGLRNNALAEVGTFNCIGWIKEKGLLLLPTSFTAQNYLFYNATTDAVGTSAKISASSLVTNNLSLGKDVQVAPLYKFGKWLMSSYFGYNWTHMTYSPKLKCYFSAGGVNGSGDNIIYSYDLQNWYPQYAVSPLVSDIIWVSELELLVAISNTNESPSYFLTSSDGFTWTTQTLNNNNWNKLAWSSTLGVLVAVGALSNNINAGYTHDLTNWTFIEANDSYNINNIQWVSDKGIFVALASQSGQVGYILTSSDGINWNQRFADGDSMFSDMTWSSRLDRMIVINSRQNKYYVSSDLVNWNIMYPPAYTSIYLKNIVWIEQLGLFILNSFQSGSPYYTYDGSSWGVLNDYQNTPPSCNQFMEYFPESNTLVRMCQTESTFTISNKLIPTVSADITAEQIVVMKGDSLSPSIQFSTNLQSANGLYGCLDLNNAPTVLGFGSSYHYTNITYSPTVGNAIAVNPYMGVPNVVYSNSTLQNWLDLAILDPFPVNDCLWIEDFGLFVACASDMESPNLFAYSYDNETWNQVSVRTGYWWKLAYSKHLGIIVCVSNNYNYSGFVYSNNGTNWSTANWNFEGSYAFCDVIWIDGPNLFAAVGFQLGTFSGVVAISYDGINWSLNTTGSPGGDGVISSIAWSPVLKIALISSTDYGHVVTSNDFRNWIDSQVLSYNSIQKLLWVDELNCFLAASLDSGTSSLARSYDGINWTAINSGAYGNTFIGMSWLKDLQKLVLLRNDTNNNIVSYSTTQTVHVNNDLQVDGNLITSGSTRLQSIQIGSTGSVINGMYVGQTEPIGSGGPVIDINVTVPVSYANPIITANMYTVQTSAPDAYTVTVHGVSYSGSEMIISFKIFRVDSSSTWGNAYYRLNYMICGI
jgi:hypothetical protein